LIPLTNKFGAFLLLVVCIMFTSFVVVVVAMTNFIRNHCLDVDESVECVDDDDDDGME
jgi:hypothetical protein